MSTKKQLELRVMRDATLTTGARLLWWEMSQWPADACCRTQIQMAKDLGVHRSTVIRWLNELREKGLVTEEVIGRNNVYVLVPSMEHIG